MLSKLRGQLDEMKSKVQFLGLVKKYLQASSPLSLPFFQNEHQASDGVPSVIGSRPIRSCTRALGKGSKC